MEAEVRHYLFAHDRLPPERRALPEHTGLRQFLVCDVAVLLDSVGASTVDTLDNTLCLHPNSMHAASVVASLADRQLPRLMDVDAYEPNQVESEGEATIDEMYDDEDENDGVDADKCDDDYVPDAVLLTMVINEHIIEQDTLNIAYTVHILGKVCFWLWNVRPTWQK